MTGAFDFQRMIKFYSKLVSQEERMPIKQNWRLRMLHEKLLRVTELSTKADLNSAEIDYLTARQAVASVF